MMWTHAYVMAKNAKEIQMPPVTCLVLVLLLLFRHGTTLGLFYAGAFACRVVVQLLLLRHVWHGVPGTGARLSVTAVGVPLIRARHPAAYQDEGTRSRGTTVLCGT